jgi:hypothetical protein
MIALDSVNKKHKLNEIVHEESVNTRLNETVKKVSANVINENDVINFQILNEICLGEETAEMIYNKITDSEIVIMFNGKYIENILNNGYVHWSQLKNSKNTETVNLFLERLSAEKEIFGINFYNKNTINTASEFLKKDAEEFKKEWKERFQTEFDTDILKKDSEDLSKIAEHIFNSSGFVRADDDVHFGPIYGCLYYDNKVINYPESQDMNKYMNETYGKSKIILDRASLQDRTTYCIGDTFDITASGYAWKENKQREERSVVLFNNLLDEENKVNIINRLKSFYMPINYIEAHIHCKIEPKFISRIIVNSSEFQDIQKKAQELTKSHKVIIIIDKD